jgi:hypothetical protein
MKKFLSIILLGSSLYSYADVSAQHVDDMLKQMVTEKVISADEAERARVRLKSLSPEQWSQIKAAGEQAAARSPASVTVASENKIQEVQGVDLDGAQFKTIQNDLRKIIPQSQD